MFKEIYQKAVLYSLLIIVCPQTSLSEVGQKGLICQCQLCDTYKISKGYWFTSKYVFARHFIQEYDSYKTVKVNGVKFQTTVTSISWTSSFINHALDRKTLILTTSTTSNRVITKSICEIFNKVDFDKKWDDLTKNYQQSHDDTISKNKI